MEASAYAQAFAEAAGARQAFRVAIVTAVHIQPSEAWIGALNAASKTATIIVVDDSDGKVRLPENWDVYDYARQREVLGDDLYKQFEMFHKSSACKTFGLWTAYQRGFDPIIVIDSDCIIPPDFVAKHLEALMASGDGWDNPIKGTGFYSRGFPYHERGKPIWAHMGLWENELDLYGTDRVGKTQIPKMPPYVDRVSNGAMFPLSGMNLSIRNDAAPYLMFLPNFGYAPDAQHVNKFSRHDDIWGGYIFQRVAQIKGFALSYGSPNVYHDTIVIPEEDAKEEEAMIAHEKEFYHAVDGCVLHQGWHERDGLTPSDVYDSLADTFGHRDSPFYGLAPAFDFAAEMFEEK